MWLCAADSFHSKSAMPNLLLFSAAQIKRMIIPRKNSIYIFIFQQFKRFGLSKSPVTQARQLANRMCLSTSFYRLSIYHPDDWLIVILSFPIGW